VSQLDAVGLALHVALTHTNEGGQVERSYCLFKRDVMSF